MQIATETINRDINYSYQHVPTIAKFAKSDKRFRAIVGPFGSGKSSGCLWELIRRGMEQKPMNDGIRRTKWAVIRNTYRQLLDTTIQTVFDWLPPRIFGQYKVADHNYFVTGFPGCEMLFMFRALDRPEHISNLLSMEITGAWVNEAREVPWTIIEAVDGRVRRYPPPREVMATWYGIIMDTNPPDEDSEFYRFYEKTRPDNAEIFHQPSGIGPDAENLPNLGDGSMQSGRDYYLELMKGKSEDYVKVYIKGEYGYVKEGKPIYDSSWNDTLHVSPYPLMPVFGRDLIVGFDFGLTPSAIITQITPRGFFNVLREHNATDMGLERFLRNIFMPFMNIEFKGYNVIAVGDPSGTARSQSDEQTCFQILRNYGFNVYPASSDDLVSRIGAVEHFLGSLGDGGKPIFQLDKSCSMLRKGFNGGYHRKKVHTSGGEKYSEEPYKNIYCVDDETEMLTDKGWMNRSQIENYWKMKLCSHVYGHVYGYDMISKTIVPTHLTGLNTLGNEVNAIKIHNSYYEFVYTENHKCIAKKRITRRRNHSEFQFIQAKDLNTSCSLLLTASPFTHNKTRYFSDWFVQLCAWVATEGHYRDDGSIIIIQSVKHNPQYVEFIDSLILGNPCLYSRLSTKKGEFVTWRIVRELAYLIRHFLPDKIPSTDFIEKMRHSQKRIFIYECLRGDGHYGGAMPDKDKIVRNRDFFLDRKITPRLTAKSLLFLDRIQMIATLAGIHCRIRGLEKEGCYVASFLKNKAAMSLDNVKIDRIRIQGAWCPQTAIGTWISRRKGVVCITGNSHPHDALQYAALFAVDSIVRAQKRTIPYRIEKHRGVGRAGY